VNNDPPPNATLVDLSENIDFISRGRRADSIILASGESELELLY
jgi:hypothetical protein